MSTEILLVVLTLLGCAFVIVWSLMPKFHTARDVLEEILREAKNGTLVCPTEEDDD
jgi:hypothetical protein